MKSIRILTTIWCKPVKNAIRFNLDNCIESIFLDSLSSMAVSDD